MLKKIGIKLTFVVGVTAIIIIGVYAYINIRFQSNVLLAEVERHASQLSETIKKATRFAMLANHRDQLHQIINTIGEEPSIREVRVFNKSGEIIYSARKRDIGRMVDKKGESCYACHAVDKPLERLAITERTRIYRLHPDSARVLGIISPIYNEPSCWESKCHVHPQNKIVLGVLDITMSLREVDRQIIQSKINTVIFAFIAILSISLIIGFFVKRWVADPVKDMVKATQIIASGNLSYRIKDKRDDELGHLARSFNNMSQKLSEARLQLFQSDKMASLGRLAAGVAHEINNPLTGILTYSSFLQKRTQDNPEFREDLGVIVRETKRCRDIVKSLLDFARQSVPKKKHAHIHDIIERALAVIENQLRINRIQVIKKYSENLPEIIADENQIQQVFINLIDNAAQAMAGAGGTITIASRVIHLEPFGITRIKDAVCPKNHSLMDASLKIDGMPSIKLKARFRGNEGFINLNPIYGKNEHHYGIELGGDGKLSLLCPKCDISLIEPEKKCPQCGSPVYFFEVLSEGKIEGCTNIDCSWQYWEKIESEGKKKFVEVSVEDTGPGIPEELVSKIFDPFFSTKGQKGTGLGLAVAWGIIDNHDGRILVESKVGKGTRFTIRLPVNSAG